MTEPRLLPLVPGLHTPDQEIYDPIFPLSPRRIPNALSLARIRHDRFTCQFCGQVSSRFHTTVQIGASPRTLGDIATICLWCWPVTNLQGAIRQRSAVMIWAPELSQVEISRHIPLLYVVRGIMGPQLELAKSVLGTLAGRSTLAARRTGHADLQELVKALSAPVPSKVAESAQIRTTEAGQLANEDLPQVSDRLARLAADGLRILPLDRRILREGDIEFNQMPQILTWLRSGQGPFHDRKEHFANIAHDWLMRLRDRLQS